MLEIVAAVGLGADEVRLVELRLRAQSLIRRPEHRYLTRILLDPLRDRFKWHVAFAETGDRTVAVVREVANRDAL